MSHPVVRRASPADLPTIRALLVELGYAGLANEPALAEVLEQMLADPSRGVWLAEDGDAALGMITTTLRPQLRLAGPELTIEELVVRRDAQGRGVGRFLLEHAKAEAARHGALRVQLTTNRTREVYTRGFYPKNGFTEAPSAVMRWTRPEQSE